jgi:S1-C subfamily serine protease
MVQADHASPETGIGGSAVEIGARTLVTACHVVNAATSVQVRRDSGKTVVPVAQVTRDPDRARDLCLLTVTEDLPAAPVAVAPSASVTIGEHVYAIGAPLGLELTLTEGLVSALRQIPGEPLPDIQFSATTAPGSSGGGLFDDQGRLIGVTVSIASKESEGLSFAYPAEWTMELSNRVLEARRIWRTRLTADGVPLGPDGDAAASGYAELSDVAKIPVGDKPAKGVADAYRQFLLLAKPRAFVLTSDGRWGTVTDPAALDALMKDCAARDVRCRLYAVDDAVVWRP